MVGGIDEAMRFQWKAHRFLSLSLSKSRDRSVIKTIGVHHFGPSIGHVGQVHEKSWVSDRGGQVFWSIDQAIRLDKQILTCQSHPSSQLFLSIK
jgi:hypothetical protein